MVKTKTNVEPTVSDETILDWTQITALKKTDIASIAAEYHKLSITKSAAEKRMKELAKAGAAILTEADVKVVMVDGLRTTRIDGTSTKLDKKKALRLGGPKWLEVYEKSQVSTPWTSLRVSEPKEDEDGEGDDE